MKGNATLEIDGDTYQVNFDLTIESLEPVKVWKNGDEFEIPHEMEDMFHDELSEKVNAGGFSTWWF
jgi:hypothetical protein